MKWKEDCERPKKNHTIKKEEIDWRDSKNKEKKEEMYDMGRKKNWLGHDWAPKTSSIAKFSADNRGGNINLARTCWKTGNYIMPLHYTAYIHAFKIL